MFLRCLAVAGIILLLGLTAATEAHAQQCSMSCGCLSGGCSCRTTGGDGGGCEASGTYCAVTTCPTQPAPPPGPDRPPRSLGSLPLPFIIAPDGSVMAINRVLVGVSPAEAGLRLVPGPALTGRWESLSEGSAAARHCTGLIVSRAYDQRTVAALRERQHRVII